MFVIYLTYFCQSVQGIFFGIFWFNAKDVQKLIIKKQLSIIKM